MKARSLVVPFRLLQITRSYADLAVARSFRYLPYPKTLYYHQLPSRSDAYALSFLSGDEIARLNPSNHGKALIGWVKKDAAKAIENAQAAAWPVPNATDGGENLPPLLPLTFTEGPDFVELMHEVVGEHVTKDETSISFAAFQKEGYMNVNDSRVGPVWGRVNDPEDILGNVLIREGKILPGTYQKFPTHRLVSNNGLVQLTDYLHEALLERLRLLLKGH
ncbi:hypothetical protein BJ742DRAFT_777942 [Cladochytrium replicatum]|nr:hypothetical protein BJ742DRAFT_777942 [Cladochytrium replicatum]